MLTLSICDGPHNGEIKTLNSTSQEIIIGRETRQRSQELLFQNDQEVSAVHCVLHFNTSNKWSLRDLNSSNGTYVNGKLLGSAQQRTIRGGDVINIGASTIKYIGGRNPHLNLSTEKTIHLHPDIQDTLVFGRVPQQQTTTVSLDLDDQVSYEHCLLFSKDDVPHVYYLKDLSSTNGTTVNGRRINPGELIQLNPNDMIAVGQTYINFTPPFFQNQIQDPDQYDSSISTVARPRQHKPRQHRASSIGRRRQSSKSSSRKQSTPNEKKSESESFLFSPRNNHRQFTRAKKQHMLKTVSRRGNIVNVNTPTMRDKDRMLDQLVEQRKKHSVSIIPESPSINVDEQNQGRSVALSFDEEDVSSWNDTWNDTWNDSNTDDAFQEEEQDGDNQNNQAIQYQVTVVSMKKKTFPFPNNVTIFKILSLILIGMIGTLFGLRMYSIPPASTTIQDSVFNATISRLSVLARRLSVLETETRHLLHYSQQKIEKEMQKKNTETKELHQLVRDITTTVTNDVLLGMQPIDQDHPIPETHGTNNVTHFNVTDYVYSTVTKQLHLKMEHGDVSKYNYAAASLNAVVLNKPSSCNGIDGGTTPFDGGKCGVNVHKLLNAGSSMDNCWQFANKHQLVIQLSECINIQQITVRGWNGIEPLHTRYRRLPYRIVTMDLNHTTSTFLTDQTDTLTMSIHTSEQDSSENKCVSSVKFEMEACQPNENDCVAIICGLMVH